MHIYTLTYIQHLNILLRMNKPHIWFWFCKLLTIAKKEKKPFSMLLYPSFAIQMYSAPLHPYLCLSRASVHCNRCYLWSVQILPYQDSHLPVTAGLAGSNPHLPSWPRDAKWGHLCLRYHRGHIFLHTLLLCCGAVSASEFFWGMRQDHTFQISSLPIFYPTFISLCPISLLQVCL